MKKLATLVVAALIGLGVAAPAMAQKTQFGEDDQIALDPNRAYIFFRTPARTTWQFFREVSETERTEHAARRAEALAVAHTRYERLARDYVRFRRSCPAGSISAYCQRPPERPVEPTDANFQFPGPGEDNWVSNAYRPRLINQDAWSGWLIAVDPGTYMLYGEIIQNQNGVVGTCFCMGTIKFAARAGEITDMGEVVPVGEDQRGDNTPTSFRLGHFATVTPPSPALRSPAQFANLRVVPAELHATRGMPNIFGVMVSRLGPVDGILGYRRDQVLDLRTGQPATQMEGTR